MSISQKILVLAGVVANGLLWAIPSDVVELIARDRQTLLGRYSRTHFSWILGVLIVTLIAFYVGLGGDRARRKLRAFRVAAVALTVVPMTCALDLASRYFIPAYYIKETLAYHRPPNQTLRGLYEDVPEAARTYPVVPAGYGKVPYTLQTDERGFRNRSDAQRYDVVTLGDSFTEGSRVSDEHPWPVRFAEKSGLTVYNLGMSGYAPQHYLASLKEVGLSLEPRWVLCLLYEENDFRSAKMITKPRRRMDKFFKRSPLLYLLDHLIVKTLSPVNAHGDVNGVEVLSWLPLAVPGGPDPNYYTFAPTLIVDLYVTEAELKANKRWHAVTGNLSEIHALCRQAGAELIIVHAPSKAHVLLPLVRDRLDAEKVRAFTALRAKRELPPPKQFLDEMFERLDTKESAVADWCRREGITFISLTQPLRREVANARQVYLTYDDHWTPVGHEVVATVIHDRWREIAGRPAGTTRPTDAP
ncbi:MAG: hypothetical protein JSV19_06465 [Phycisphaerales bacterium]|nr:MAG: hypothetical protein JSV19_06465 [Phycisphaerales bacterium]